MKTTPSTKHRLFLPVVLQAAVFGLLSACSLIEDRAFPSAGEPWQLNGIAEGARVQTLGTAEWQPVKGNAEIPAGSNLELQAQSGLLRPDVGAVMARSDSRLRLPNSDGEKLLEHLEGRARYIVEPRSEEHFDVIAPQLAVRTSGAVFDVQADALGAEVDVIEGAVKIWTNDRGSRTRIRAGQSARVRAETLARLEVRERPGSSFVQVAFGNTRDSADPGRSETGGDDRQPSENDAGSPENSGSGGQGGGDRDDDDDDRGGNRDRDDDDDDDDRGGNRDRDDDDDDDDRGDRDRDVDDDDDDRGGRDRDVDDDDDDRDRGNRGRGRGRGNGRR
ncbi:MAG: FecR domain-containing protein [Geminicoccaceae bacterium]